ncbi:MAG: diadenylate cyclase CdaA [Candidatus Omnitrophica bacterium]|nr:diadenylate cyclase CdaA [Candidatus Omnitrophota bacterium]
MNLSHLIFYWKPALEILILWFVIYQIMLFFEGTRAIQVARGIAIILIAFFLFQRLGLARLDWLIRNFFATSIIVLLIIFHPEIRQGLARLGQRYIFASAIPDQEWDYILKEIATAVKELCRDKLGALIAIERQEALTVYIESGIFIDAKISSDLLQAIFTPNNPLHDGGVIIQNGRIMAAGCLFPIAQNQDLSRIFGTRHRAALGLSEDVDALIVVISEERQDISLAYQGKLYNGLSREDFLLRAKEILNRKKINA